MNETIDLVLPCYNPPPGWAIRVVENIYELKKRIPYFNINIYIVNDGSKTGFDRDSKIFLKQSLQNIRIIEYERNMGKGYALRKAVCKCQSKYIIYTDCDFPYTTDSFLSVVEALLHKADVVVAVRNKEYKSSLPFYRKYLTVFSRICNKFIFRMKITDTQGGLKGFNGKGREAFLLTSINTYLFDTEFIYIAARKKLNIVTVDAEIRDSLKMTNFRLNTIITELLNLSKIFPRK